MIRPPTPLELCPLLPPPLSPLLQRRRWCEAVLVVGANSIAWALIFPRAAVHTADDFGPFDVILDWTGDRRRWVEWVERLPRGGLFAAVAGESVVAIEKEVFP